MRSTSFTLFVVVLGVFLVTTSVVMAEEKATIALIEGAVTTYQVRDKSGQLITVQVPAWSHNDVEVNKSAAQAKGTVQAKVMSIHRDSNRVQVRTQEGQAIVLEMSPASLTDIRPGDTFTLVVPQ